MTTRCSFDLSDVRQKVLHSVRATSSGHAAVQCGCQSATNTCGRVEALACDARVRVMPQPQAVCHRCHKYWVGTPCPSQQRCRAALLPRVYQLRARCGGFSQQPGHSLHCTSQRRRTLPTAQVRHACRPRTAAVLRRVACCSRLSPTAHLHTFTPSQGTGGCVHRSSSRSASYDRPDQQVCHGPCHGCLIPCRRLCYPGILPFLESLASPQHSMERFLSCHFHWGDHLCAVRCDKAGWR